MPSCRLLWYDISVPQSISQRGLTGAHQQHTTDNWLDRLDNNNRVGTCAHKHKAWRGGHLYRGNPSTTTMHLITLLLVQVIDPKAR